MINATTPPAREDLQPTLTAKVSSFQNLQLSVRLLQSPTGPQGNSC